jgi:hypothetical protein
MAKRITAEIEINASPSRIWSVLTDFEQFPYWNPFIRKAQGELAIGGRLKLRVHTPGGPNMTLRPRLLTVETEREIRWLGHFLVPGLFDGEHHLLIEPLYPSKVRFVQSEQFSGLLVPFLGGMISRGALRGFESMNEALKSRIESQSLSGSS